MQKLFLGRVASGWGVVRDQPWHFAGLCRTEADAAIKAARLGPNYAVRYGQHRRGSPFFMVQAPGPALDG